MPMAELDGFALHIERSADGETLLFTIDGNERVDRGITAEMGDRGDESAHTVIRFDALPTVRDQRSVSLRLMGQSIDNRLCAHIIGRVAKQVTGVSQVSLRYTSITDRGLLPLTAFRNLTALHITDSDVTERCLGRIQGVGNLKELRLSGRDGQRLPITDIGVAHLKRLHGLQALHLANCDLTDTAFDHIMCLSHLRELGLRSTMIAGSGIEELGELVNLEALDLRGSQINDGTLRSLARLSHLRELGIGDGYMVGMPPDEENQWDSMLTRRLVDQMEDEFVDVSGKGMFSGDITTAGLQPLSLLKQLELLDLSGAGIVDAGVEPLKELNNFRYLYLGFNNITDEGSRHLERLSELEQLMLAGNQITDSGLQSVSRLNKLTSLDLRHTRITDDGVRSLRRLTALKYLNLSYCENVTDRSVEPLRGLKRLERLELFGTSISSDGVTRIVQVLPSCKVYR